MERVVRQTLWAAIAVSTLSLAGCVSMVETRRTADQGITTAGIDANALLETVPKGTPARGAVISELPYVDVNSVPVKPRLPIVFDRHVTFLEPMGLPIGLLAQRLEEETGLRITYQAELIEAGAAQSASAPMAPTPASAPPIGPLGGDSIPLAELLAGLPPIPAASPGVGASGASLIRSVPLNHNGSVRVLLDTVAAHIGGYWRYDPGTNRVTLYRYLTEVFRIAAVVGQGSSQSSIGSGTSADAGMSAGKSQVNHQTDGSAWKDVESTVKALLSPEGVFVLNPSLGTLVVRDRPDRMDAIRDYVNATNRTLATHVGFDVRIYRVVMNDQDIRGMNWQLYFNRFAQNARWAGAWESAMRPTSDGDLSSMILRVADGERWGASTLIVEALSALGKTSVVTSTYAQTINNVPAPIRNTRRRAYVAQTSQSVAGGGTGNVVASGTQLTPGEVETGLVMYLLPHVQDDGKRVLLQSMLSLSTLDAIETFGSVDGQRIQLPQVSAREYQQTVWMNSGETLVIAGMEQVEDTFDRDSPLDARLWAIAGRSTARNERETFVVTITPTVQAAHSGI